MLYENHAAKESHLCLFHSGKPNCFNFLCDFKQTRIRFGTPVKAFYQALYLRDKKYQYHTNIRGYNCLIMFHLCYAIDAGG